MFNEHEGFSKFLHIDQRQPSSLVTSPRTNPFAGKYLSIFGCVFSYSVSLPFAAWFSLEVQNDAATASSFVSLALLSNHWLISFFSIEITSARRRREGASNLISTFVVVNVVLCTQILTGTRNGMPLRSNFHISQFGEIKVKTKRKHMTKISIRASDKKREITKISFNRNVKSVKPSFALCLLREGIRNFEQKRKIIPKLVERSSAKIQLTKNRQYQKCGREEQRRAKR